MDEIVDYLAMPYLAFWRWEDHGQIAAWWDGRTIAFKAELGVAIEALAPRGLPPFGALLLVYAACRENAEEEPSRTGQLAALLEYFSGDPSLLDNVAPCVKVVHGAWQELQGVPNVKSKLAYVIFHEMRGVKTSASWSKWLPTVLANPELFGEKPAIADHRPVHGSGSTPADLRGGPSTRWENALRSASELAGRIPSRLRVILETTYGRSRRSLPSRPCQTSWWQTSIRRRPIHRLRAHAARRRLAAIR
jgi:hypothetical protein